MQAAKPELISALRGLTTALVTPLDADGNLDTASLERVIEHQIANGTACLFPLGWCGEGPSLPDTVREQTIRRTCAIAAGRVPVMAGISEQSLARVEPMLRIAEDAGADYVLATPPFSYEIPPDLVLRFFEGLAAMSTLPLVIYENGEIAIAAGVENLLRLSERPNVVGVKATVTANALRAYHGILDDPERFVVISGDEYLFDYALFLGIRHFTMGGPGNFSPKWCVETQALAEAGNWPEVQARQRAYVAFLEDIYAESVTAYGVVKYMMAKLGLAGDAIASPHRPLTDAEKRGVERLMDSHPDYFQ